MAVEVIAEVGSVHDGSFGNAKKLIELAKAAGADTVKFQMHLPEFETTRSAPSPGYFRAEPRFDYFRRTGFSTDQWRQLVEHAAEVGVGFCCSPFSLEALDALLSLNVEKIKIPSGEVTNLPLLEAAAARSKVVLLSSGMSSWAELDAAVAAMSPGSARKIVMQCTSEYPCQPENVGLNVIGQLRERYGWQVGYSDHTLGLAAPLGAVFAGATVIEKHLTFSKAMYGSDAAHSMEPEEFRRMTVALREAETIAAHPVDKDALERYREMKSIFEKSLVAIASLPEGAVISKEHLGFKKPGIGIKPSQMGDVIGRRLRRSIAQDHMFSMDDFE